ncbi:hypothetical protein HDU77_001831 [Chytriomyces hyalinus]|nr:hypothetical protein HDU77_001831 [Chytriomyces hyalinus]
MRLQTPTLLAALILAATGHASPAAYHPQLSQRSIKRDGLAAPQSQTLKVGGAALYVPVLAIALFAVGGLVYRKLFAKKDRPVPTINTADPPLPDLQQISTSRDADSESIRSWIVHDLNSDDDEDHRRSSSLARPSIAITSSKYTRPSAMESPFSPTRKHIYPDPSQRSPKVKDFRVDVANVILDWPRSSERERESSPQQWRSPEPSNSSSSGYANANTNNNAGDATRSVKSLDLKSVRSVGGASVTQSHSLNTRAHSSASKQNTALGTMPGGLQEHLAPSESEPAELYSEPPSSATQHAAAPPPPVPSIPHIYTSRVTVPKDSPGLGLAESTTNDVANEVVQYMSTLSLRKSSLESESGSSSSWYLDVKREDGELSPAPSSVFMDILGQNEECDV